MTTGNVGSPVSASCSICSYSAFSAFSFAIEPFMLFRATAAHVRAAISCGVAGSSTHSSARSSMALRRATSSVQPTMTAVERARADSAESRSATGSLVVISTARTVVSAGHHHVEQHDGGAHGLEERERLVAVMCDGDGISAGLEVLPNDLGVVMIVVHHEDGWQI